MIFTYKSMLKYILCLYLYFEIKKKILHMDTVKQQLRTPYVTNRQRTKILK